jgi:hypothetical protein
LQRDLLNHRGRKTTTRPDRRAPLVAAEELPGHRGSRWVAAQPHRGFAGIVRERTLRLDDLPDDDAYHWRELLAEDRLALLADAPTHPDAYFYGVRCEAVSLDVTIPEPALEPDLRDLFERTLAP